MSALLWGYLGAVVVLAAWHAGLVWSRGEPAWMRRLVRVALALVTLTQGVTYVVIQGMTRKVSLDQAADTIARVQSVSDTAEWASLALLGLTALGLLSFTIRRVLRGPVGSGEIRSE